MKLVLKKPVKAFVQTGPRSNQLIEFGEIGPMEMEIELEGPHKMRLISMWRDFFVFNYGKHRLWIRAASLNL